ncbi:cytochrome c biogenesis protein ResB [Paenibacillus urinalis]|uniref:Cytochrome c biogenesis protein ResB n=1 Tax=Paenibacillus urinalis TaxID=521520 RepID=A0AAX3MV30_9BACL|nr:MULTISPECIES: cytochrome c biogenesis protein ResB [Paenibacillus]WDH81268.1 cytochrome c biogenesis protein ResB [Paenibacillus urinalis]WDH97319.1 cytochrome c biogenesis protein ResB [Paenibacillus urinalis]WDI00982.1 cytochrome c biogenesis protein ResB [Paenibacillus urinalis]GAK39972.1 ResB family protein [Paenibacillus sp. TCA20]
MIQNTKCECGHQNPVGTVLCEACGKPQHQEDLESREPLEMRYDGIARRSQKSDPTIIDLVWNFFSSVKVAIYLIVITLLGAMLGTIYPQENAFINMDPSVYYKETYGTLGHIYYSLGLSHTYESWWFILLLVMIGASLVICSLDRVLPLYKALSKQRIPKHIQFLTRQRVTYQTAFPDEEAEEWIKKAVAPLKKKGYRVKTDGSALLAEKYRFSRWGPYVIHIGLIIFLLAVLARGLPGLHMDEHISFPQGEIKNIPDTTLYLENIDFRVEYYSEEETPEEFRNLGRIVPKLFETEAKLYECTADCTDPSRTPQLQEVTHHFIRVNDPLDYEGLKAYQYDFDLTPILRSVSPEVIDLDTGISYGKIQLDMQNPEQHFEAGPYSLTLKEKYMDFGLNDEGVPVSKSPNPNAPAFLFAITGPDLPEEGIQYLYFPLEIDKERFQQDVINERLNGGSMPLELNVDGMENVDIIESTSYLNIRIDKAMPFVWVGASIVMLGLVLGFYWQHRRVWIRIDNGTLVLGAHTNKNWFGLRREVADVLQQLDIIVDEKLLDNGGNKA